MKAESARIDRDSGCAMGAENVAERHKLLKAAPGQGIYDTSLLARYYAGSRRIDLPPVCREQLPHRPQRKEPQVRAVEKAILIVLPAPGDQPYQHGIMAHVRDAADDDPVRADKRPHFAQNGARVDEIAARTRTTPARARIHFHRAKKSLKERLACCV